MGLTINRWIHLSLMNIICTAICNGQLTLVAETVPFFNEPWILKCKAVSITTTVSISDPSSTTIGFCVPALSPFPAKCTPNPGYALVINETENTVTLTRTITNIDNGTWTCTHSGNSTSYVVQSPLLSRNYPLSKAVYFDHGMTAESGIEIDTKENDYTFTFHYGCVSTNLKFEWTLVPGVYWDDISNTASTNLTCGTNQAFESTQRTSVILPKVTQDGSKLKVSVYVDGYYSVQAVEEYTFNVTFSVSSPTTITQEMSSTTKAIDQTTSSQNPSTASSHSEKTETNLRTTTDNDLTSTSVYVTPEVTTIIKPNEISTVIAFFIPVGILLLMIAIMICICIRFQRLKRSKSATTKSEDVPRIHQPKRDPTMATRRPNQAVDRNKKKSTLSHERHGNTRNDTREQSDSSYHPFDNVWANSSHLQRHIREKRNSDMAYRQNAYYIFMDYTFYQGDGTIHDDQARQYYH